MKFEIFDIFWRCCIGGSPMIKCNHVKTLELTKSMDLPEQSSLALNQRCLLKESGFA